MRPDAHRLSPTSQIGLYPGEDIASYTETTTQALEQHGTVDGIESCAQGRLFVRPWGKMFPCNFFGRCSHQLLI